MQLMSAVARPVRPAGVDWGAGDERSARLAADLAESSASSCQCGIAVDMVVFKWIIPKQKALRGAQRHRAGAAVLDSLAAGASLVPASAFAHGSNDGQKGMGLIMLILIGTVPTAYALNHAVTYKQSMDFVAQYRSKPFEVLDHYAPAGAKVGRLCHHGRSEVCRYGYRPRPSKCSLMVSSRRPAIGRRSLAPDMATASRS